MAKKNKNLRWRRSKKKGKEVKILHILQWQKKASFRLPSATRVQIGRGNNERHTSVCLFYILICVQNHFYLFIYQFLPLFQFHYRKCCDKCNEEKRSEFWGSKSAYGEFHELFIEFCSINPEKHYCREIRDSWISNGETHHSYDSENEEFLLPNIAWTSYYLGYLYNHTQYYSEKKYTLGTKPIIHRKIIRK